MQIQDGLSLKVLARDHKKFKVEARYTVIVSQTQSAVKGSHFILCHLYTMRNSTIETYTEFDKIHKIVHSSQG